MRDSEPSSRRDRALYVISVAAELAGVHPQTLRIYERRGLLDPSRTRGGSRRYSERDIEQLRQIQELTNAGVNLEGVKRVLELQSDLERMRQEVEALRAEIARVTAEAREAVERTHRYYRRDLVPAAKSALVWRPPGRARRSAGATSGRGDAPRLSARAEGR
jgi:MerR family transcriptional regulator/heat shock protein HspR